MFCGDGRQGSVSCDDRLAVWTADDDAAGGGTLVRYVSFCLSVALDGLGSAASWSWSERRKSASASAEADDDNTLDSAEEGAHW